jgi:MoxR-like ATPase
MKKFSSLLEVIGVFGYSPLSKGILAALIAKEPLLLIGDNGTGKTMLAEKLSLMLGISNDAEQKEFNAYDASKSLFEDVVGFPDPILLQQGKLSYIESDITIWNKKFILIDEISRANPAMQNKWLEIIRSRRLMGKPIPNLQYIFSAMNPADYLGANLLDGALADRFFLIINIPSYFDRIDLSKIINSVNEINESTPAKLKTLIEDVQKVGQCLDPKLINSIDNYILDFSKKVEDLGLSISPRKCAMMKKSLSLFMAMDLYEGELTSNKIAENFALCSNYCWNYHVTEDDPHIDILNEAYKSAIANIQDAGDFTKSEFEKYNKKNKSRGTKEKKFVSDSSDTSDDFSAINDDEEEGDLWTFFQILGTGIELFTVGFYEVVIKKNTAWKSKMKINN